MSPVIALKTALRARMLADAALTSLLGGARIYDEVPRSASTPYIVFGDATVRDNGTVSDAGHITDLALNIWSQQGGTHEALLIADCAAQLIEDTTLELSGHHLVNAHIATTEVRRQPGKGLTRVTLRLRLVTEVI